MAERTDRVEPRGPSCGQKASRHNAREQDKDHGGQRQWIEHLDTKQLVTNNTAEGESAGNTDDAPVSPSPTALPTIMRTTFPSAHQGPCGCRFRECALRRHNS